MHVYYSRDTGILNLAVVKAKIIKVGKIENHCKIQDFCKKSNILQRL